MRSGKSWFSPTLYKKNLTRFWPVWGLYLVIWLFAFPVSLVLKNVRADTFAHRTVLTVIPELGLFMAFVFSAFSAACVWHYLCSGRAAGLMHTLPIRREGLFCTNFLSGLTFLAGPNLAVFLLTLLAEAAAGVVDAGALAMWFFAMTLMELFFFCFATLCAMLTGHVLGMPAFYLIFNFLASGLWALVDSALRSFVFGYAIRSHGWVVWLTPVRKLLDRLTVETDGGGIYRFVGLGYILIYALAGLVMAALALALYCRRDMERAGDVVTVPWLRPVFRYGVGFCGALAAGTLVFAMFRGMLPATAWTLLAFMLLWGTVFYFIAWMLLEKSFRVFRHWKGCLPLLAALVVLTCVMELDLTGYERRQPNVYTVESASFRVYGTRPYDDASTWELSVEDQQAIQAVLDAHRAIIESKESIEDFDGLACYTEDGLPEWAYYTVGITYRIKDGTVQTREYNDIPVTREALDDPDSPAALLQAVLNQPGQAAQAYGLTAWSASDVAGMEVTQYEYITQAELAQREQWEWDEWNDDVSAQTPEERVLYEAEAVAVRPEAWERLYEAVLADLADGNLGRRYLLDDEQRQGNCYYNDLVISFYRTAATPQASESQPASIVTGRTISITLQASAKRTLAALQEEGVLKGGELNLILRSETG